ncbi:hypothetical protein [Chryseobacterium sp. BIGb0232]|uniref:hypothetical protein n=1 Tax=Chryseobacterium sp. BIGb0232 TaxID=2940598 RepID=UPI000F4760F0|nr:hypothetical protein [Chryseobacterium sp. BIGb0232]MCS4303699.1 hypothetical protein [Chryseobacterium sp. BIGb0232]ROS10397.1 hypothetical protein EDF65_4279 [Chryseobacterium nakagawai]
MRKLLLLVFMVMMTTVFGQEKMKLVSGDFEVLRDQADVNVEVKFEDVLFMKENITEAQYLENRKKQVMDNPKRGEAAWNEWIGEWEKYKKENYVDRLLKGLNASGKKEIFKKDSSAKYTLILNTKWVFPGWHAGLIAMPTEMSGNIQLVETNNPSVVLATVELNKYDRFSGMDVTVMEYGRLAAAYESIGKVLSRQIKRNLK